jgi:hypothetical protein
MQHCSIGIWLFFMVIVIVVQAQLPSQSQSQSQSQQQVQLECPDDDDEEEENGTAITKKQECQLGVITATPRPDPAVGQHTSSPSFRWIPEAKHPCTIARMTMEEIFQRFGPEGLPPLYPHPLVITTTTTIPTTTTSGTARFKNATATVFPESQTTKDFVVVVVDRNQEPPPEHNSSSSSSSSSSSRIKKRLRSRNEIFRNKTLPHHILSEFPVDFSVELTSSNSFSEHRRQISLKQYIDEQLQANEGRGETLPDQQSNETWYLFGETFTEPWTHLLRWYHVPPCRACRDMNSLALAFGIGNRGSGVQWHVHGPGFSEAIHGRKHWILSPDRPKSFHPNQTSRHWMEYVYTAMDDPNERPYECTLDTGDLIYFPDMWWHATINLDAYTAFVSTFTQEHLFLKNNDGGDWERDL